MLEETYHKGASLLMTGLALIFGTVITADAQLRIAPPERVANRIACHVGSSNYWLTPVPKKLRIVPSDTEEMQAVLDKINPYTGLTINIDLVPVTDSPNAEICPSDPDPNMNGSLRNYIAYNPEWVQGVYNDTNNDWAVYAIIAHEVGHYYLNHDRASVGSNPQIEAAADEYAGEILARMGASLKDAQSAFNSARLHTRGPTHPSIEQRKASVKKGWEKVNNISPTSAPKYTYQIIGWIESGRRGNRTVINQATHHEDRFPIQGNLIGFYLTVIQTTDGKPCAQGTIKHPPNAELGWGFPNNSTSSRRGEPRPAFAFGVQQAANSPFLELLLNPGLNCTLK